MLLQLYDLTKALSNETYNRSTYNQTNYNRIQRRKMSSHLDDSSGQICLKEFGAWSPSKGLAQRMKILANSKSRTDALPHIHFGLRIKN
jgi:hypothetical protein